MDFVESSLCMALLSLLWTILYVRADLTIRVSEDKCDNVYDLQGHNKINFIFINNERTLRKASPCLITIKSALENSLICIRHNTKFHTSCGLLLDVFFGTKPSSPYDSGVFTCSRNKPRCTSYSHVFTQFTQLPVIGGYNFNFTEDVTVYLEGVTTTQKPTYTYKSPKGTFNPLASLMIPIGIAVGVCACTCFVICCVLCCGKCCKIQSTTTANTQNNEELHELNDRPTNVASAPELPGDFNQTSQWTDNNRPYNYSEEPPDYNQALLVSHPSHPSSRYSVEGYTDTSPNAPPPPYPGV